MLVDSCTAQVRKNTFDITQVSTIQVSTTQVSTTSCILISFAGVCLVLLGKANEGTITATGGLASTSYCLKLSKDANDRLDEIGEELRIEN